jgi:type II secretory pathway component GspD/PulD (secretin)
MLSVNRLAYIRDYDIQAAGMGGGYDPVIDYVTHGLVLDIRPIVSYNRKYVILDVRATLSELRALIPRVMPAAPQVPPAPGVQPQAPPPGAPLQINMPWISLQKVNASVLVPDRGTVVLSGLKEIALVEARSGTPFFEHIPILSFFFSKKVKRQEKRRLHILITPEIIDLSEHERRFLD